MEKIKVLVVDDSLFFREMLIMGLSSDPAIQVVGTASNPYEARDKILTLKPHVMTLDIEMPRMDGIEFVEKLMGQYPIPVVMVSGISEKVLDALKAGAVDFVRKPQGGLKRGWEPFLNELCAKIKIASSIRLPITGKERKRDQGEPRKGELPVNPLKLIAIGASTGGPNALHRILSALPADMPGIVVVQHMPPVFTRMFAQRLNEASLLEVKEAESGDRIFPGRVLIAPGDYHMQVVKKGRDYLVECFQGDKINGHRPSADVLFYSVAQAVGREAAGVILTGMGQDGARGLLAMRRKGARTVGQDEESCVVYGMPKAAAEMGAVERQVSLDAMAQAIIDMMNQPPTTKKGGY